MDDEGWVGVERLLVKVQISMEELEQVVNTNDKKRFAFNFNKTKIRASQGHSLKIDIGLKPIIPPKFLYHGTASKNVKAILKKGLLKMKRNHVHLSPDYETALNVANRYCKNDTPHIFKIDTYPMIVNYIRFYESDNGVWLCDYIDPKYIKI
jgi:putative RNA 2'-phosphotransferase